MRALKIGPWYTAKTHTGSEVLQQIFDILTEIDPCGEERTRIRKAFQRILVNLDILAAYKEALQEELCDGIADLHLYRQYVKKQEDVWRNFLQLKEDDMNGIFQLLLRKYGHKKASKCFTLLRGFCRFESPVVSRELVAALKKSMCISSNTPLIVLPEIVLPPAGSLKKYIPGGSN